MRHVEEPGSESSASGSSAHGDEEKIAQTVPTAHGGPAGTEVEEDVMSDPALDDRIGSDWTDEGGAGVEGPATDTGH